MYTAPAKKTLILNILDILKRYSDEDHRLSQKEIVDILETEYAMTVERKAVKRNLMNLIDCGYDLEYSITTRMTPKTDAKTGKSKLSETSILSDFYLKREFDDSELRLLIDSVLSSGHIPARQGTALIEKLSTLSNIYFRAKIMPPGFTGDNKQFFYTIDILDEAIEKNRQVSFEYCEYGTDKKLHPKRRPDGSIREYVINPYRLAAKNGRYYLICNYDKYNDISNYRVDRIRNIKLSDTPAKPFRVLNGAENSSLDFSKYMTEHIYMFSSDNLRTEFRITRAMISDVIDTFGPEVLFSDETESHVTVSARVNEMAMIQYAKSFAPYVVVLSPQSLVDKIKGDLEKTVQAYASQK